MEIPHLRATIMFMVVYFICGCWQLLHLICQMLQTYKCSLLYIRTNPNSKTRPKYTVIVCSIYNFKIKNKQEFLPIIPYCV